MIDTADLPTTWRAKAELLREHGADGHAKAIERCANELDERDAKRDAEPLTLTQAVQWSGFSEKQIRRLIHQGDLEDVGNGQVRVRRGDLPRHARSRREPSLAARRALGHHVVES